MITNIGYKFQDWSRGTSSVVTKDFLMKSQYWERSVLENYQIEKIKKLLSFSFNHSQYYNKLFKNVNFNPCIDEITFTSFKKLPIITKENLFVENILTNKGKLENVRIGKTGGTTGPPLIVYKDVNTRSFSWGSYYRFYEWMDIKLGDPIIIFWGAPFVLKDPVLKRFKNKLIDLTQNTLTINSFNIHTANISEIVKSIRRKKPVLARGYLSALLQFADFLDKQNIKLKIPRISTTTEMLLPHQRSYLENIFSAEVFDQYGCTEIGSIAFECKAHSGLHISEEHVYVEILDEYGNDTGIDKGTLVVTDLDNFIWPLIRYKIGDVTSFKLEKNCKCGINLKKINPIQGREAHTILLKNGSRVHGVFFTDILYELRDSEVFKIKRFQIYQNKLDSIEFRIEKAVPISNIFIKKLRKSLEKFFDNVYIIILDKIENEKSGKFLYIKSDLK